MLQQVSKGARSSSGDEGALLRGSSLTETLNAFVEVVQRQFPVFIVLIACSATLGLLYLLTTPSTYTATATMVIDTRKVQLFQQQSVLGDTPIDAGTVQTQVELLKSPNVSLSVIRDLHLADDPEFTSGGAGLVGAVLGLFASSETRSTTQLERRALATFESRRTVNRVGLTYVMEIGFRSFDPTKAAAVANAIADAYITDQLEAKYQATRRASVWLQDRIKELRTQASAADRAVVNFKQSNNIVDTGGKLMNEQQVTEVNSQLILSHAATAEAKARLDRINDIMRQAIPDASVADALKSEVIIKLRNQYLDLSAREAIWSAKYGATHLATVSLRNQMLEIRRSITDEMKKIAESYKSDYQIAQAREEAIRSSLKDSVSESQTTSQAQIQLRELESNSQSYRSMYDNFLQRYMEAVQQQSFPITEARLIGPASRPNGRSQPNTALVLAVTTLGGLMLSFGVAFLREFADRVFRTSAQIEDRLQVNCLAMLPVLKSKALPTTETATNATLPRHQIASRPTLLRYVVDAPFSQFTEALRAVKVAADLGNAVKANKVIGVTSTLPSEGKSTTSANFAQLIAHAGSRVLLIDADLRNPSLSHAMAPKAVAGLVDIVAGRATLADVQWRDASSSLHFLPGGGSAKLMHTNEILASAGINHLVASLRDIYDYIVVDLAPLAPVVDTRATTSFIDSYVYVIEWGRTKIDVVEHSLGDAREVYDRLLGVVLNKADMAVLGRYERYRSNNYDRKYYSRYGYPV